jgi:N-acetylneuraminic acid mutarotase
MADGSNKNVERYDPLTNRWTTEPSMQADRSGLAVAAYKDKLYVFGGQHQGLQALNINEILNPANNTERSTNNNK